MVDIEAENVNGKVIILGDCHFGKTKFSQEMFDNQAKFFNEQLFPYMLKNGITTIIQMGDFFDNRRSADINFINDVRKHIFDKMVEHNINMIEILGNHDIYYKNTRDVNLMQVFESMYPKNLRVVTEREYFYLNEKRCMLIPWILESEGLNEKELKGVEYLFGHFEIQSFEMAKGHVDENSNLSPAFFNKCNDVKRVFSGHYHIVGNKGKINYVGTPYQLDWGDYQDMKSFYVFDTTVDDVVAIENKISKNYVKIKYNTDKPQGKIEISGLGPNMYFDKVTDIDVSELSRHNLKFFINAVDETKYHEEVIFLLREKGCNFKVTNNVEISLLIGTDFVQEEDEDSVSTRELILKTIKDEAPELMDIVNELLQETEQED